MTTLIRGGTIIDAENTYRADVLCADPQDGGTILHKTWLNFVVAFDLNVYFWKTFKADRLTADFIRDCVAEVRKEFLDADAFVVGVISDSASNMVKAMSKEETEADFPEEACNENDDWEASDENNGACRCTCAPPPKSREERRGCTMKTRRFSKSL